jgi:hypothetical protein
MKYYKFQLSPGQQAPPGSTGRGYEGWIVLEGEWPAGHEAITRQQMTLEEVTAYVTAKHNELADAAVFEQASEVRQRQILARATELLEKKIDGTLTAEEEAELTQLRAMRDALKALRATHEANAAAEIAAATV